MANPTKGWDKVPVFAWYMELDGVTPKVGAVKLTLAQRVTSTDGRTVFPGGTITATLGGTDNDTAVLNQVRAAMQAVDQAAATAGGGTFDAAAWGAAWDARLPGAFFTSFPASDDPDIVERGFQVKVEEKLASGDGKIYYITPLLADLAKPIPGVNLGTIAVPPGAPTAPAPIYQKGQPGGVASLDATGVVPLAQIPSGIGGAVDSVNGQTGVVALTAADVSAVPTTRTVAGKPLSADVTLVKGDVGLPNVDDTADVSKPVSTAQQAAIDAKYTKPASGVPKSDLEAGVQTSLGKADTALQSVTLPTADTLSGATTVGKAVMKAADAPTARTAIGAGTSSVVIGTGSGQAADAAATQAALDAQSQDVVYDGTSWPAASAAAVVRRFISTGYPSAPAPTGLSGADLWFRDRSAV